MSFTREEYALLHEMVSYALKRTFATPEQVRLKDLQGRIEARLLDDRSGDDRPFGVTEPEIDALQGAAEIYCEALRHPQSAVKSQRKAAQLLALIGRFQKSGGLLDRIRRMWGRA